MKYRLRKGILGIYNLIISLGAVYLGIEMILSRNGIFAEEYPKEWLSKVPFESWVLPGIIGILVFGLGNLIAAVFCFAREDRAPWVASLIMGFIFFISLVAQVIILGEAYLATAQFFILSIIQILLSGYVYLGYKKYLKEGQ